MKTKVKSKYKMGWIMVCFDLPVTEAELLRETNRFRKFLLNEGYFMLQQSIYIRNCVTYEKSEWFINKIRQHAPLLGRISVFYLTNKQWKDSVNIEVSTYLQSKYRIKPQENMPKQISFW